MGRLVMIGLLLTGVVVWFAGSALWGMTADEIQDGYRLWIQDRDAVPGGTVPFRLLRDDGKIPELEIELTRVKRRYIETPDDSVDFDVVIPTWFEVGHTYDLDLFLGNRHLFTRHIEIHGEAMGVVRRIGRIALALACAAFGAWFLALITRFMYRRRFGDRMAAWTLAVPFLACGYLAFVTPVMAALGLTSPWGALLLFVAWGMLLLVPARAALHRGLPRYEVSPALIATDLDGPFRAAQHQQKIGSAGAMLDAWTAAGLHARRRGREILIAQGGAIGVVPLTRAELFTDEPFAIHATSDALAQAAMDAAAKLLGPLRATAPNGRELTGIR